MASVISLQVNITAPSFHQLMYAKQNEVKDIYIKTTLWKSNSSLAVIIFLDNGLLTHLRKI
jgi:hypothetical protein